MIYLMCLNSQAALNPPYWDLCDQNYTSAYSESLGNFVTYLKRPQTLRALEKLIIWSGNGSSGGESFPRNQPTLCMPSYVCPLMWMYCEHYNACSKKPHKLDANWSFNLTWLWLELRIRVFQTLSQLEWLTYFAHYLWSLLSLCDGHERLTRIYGRIEQIYQLLNLLSGILG